MPCPHSSSRSSSLVVPPAQPCGPLPVWPPVRVTATLRQLALEHSGGSAASAATATGGTLAKLSAMVAAGALSAALVTTPTASVGPAMADRDHTQRDSSSSPRTGSSDLALGDLASAGGPGGLDPDNLHRTRTRDRPRGPGQPARPDRAAPGTQPHRGRLWHHWRGPLGGGRHRLGRDTHDNRGSPITRPVTTSGSSRRSNQPSFGTPTATTPTAPSPGAPAPRPGLRGLSTAMANVAAQNPKANSNALTALQNAAARLIDKQSPPRP